MALLQNIVWVASLFISDSHIRRGISGRGNWQYKIGRLIRAQHIWLFSTVAAYDSWVERVIGRKAGIFKLTLKLVQVIEELRCFAKQFAILSWTNLPYWFRGQSDWSAGSKNFYPPRSEAFSGNRMILTTSIRDMSQKGPILSSIEIMTYCSFAKPMLDNFKICKEERGSGETN